jgi:hypothetical protein
MVTADLRRQGIFAAQKAENGYSNLRRPALGGLKLSRSVGPSQTSLAPQRPQIAMVFMFSKEQAGQVRMTDYHF